MQILAYKKRSLEKIMSKHLTPIEKNHSPDCLIDFNSTHYWDAINKSNEEDLRDSHENFFSYYSGKSLSEQIDYLIKIQNQIHENYPTGTNTHGVMQRKLSWLTQCSTIGIACSLTFLFIGLTYGIIFTVNSNISMLFASIILIETSLILLGCSLYLSHLGFYKHKQEQHKYQKLSQIVNSHMNRLENKKVFPTNLLANKTLKPNTINQEAQKAARASS